jgi:Ca-activated chloride channel family protein
MTPINAAGIAKQNDIQIHTIGIGDEAARGEDRVDFKVLQAAAERTGGSFSNAEDEQALGRIYAAIDQATAADTRTLSWRPRTSLLVWPAGGALLLLIVGYTGLLAFRGIRARA